MSVLARDIDAYQRAVEAYQRQVRGYNNTVNNYNDSFFTDANGNLYVVGTSGAVFTADPATGALTSAALPEGKTLFDFGLTPNKSNPDYLMLRQNPTEVSKRTYDTVSQFDMDGNPIYLIVNPDGSASPLPLGARITGSRQVQEPDSEGNLITRTIYTAEENTSTYLAEPGDPTFKLRAKRPDPTAAQMRKLSQPGLAEQERTGIISDEIIKGGGVLGGGRVRAGGTSEPPPPPGDPLTPYDPWDPNVNPLIP